MSTSLDFLIRGVLTCMSARTVTLLVFSVLQLDLGSSFKVEVLEGGQGDGEHAGQGGDGLHEEGVLPLVRGYHPCCEHVTY